MTLFPKDPTIRLLPLVLGLVIGNARIGWAQDSAEQALTSRGLSLLSRTTTWVNERELQLRKLSKEADSLHRRVGTIEADLVKRIEQNRNRWIAGGAGNRAVEPIRLLGTRSVRRRVIELSQVRYELTSAVRRMRQLATESETIYLALRNEPAVGFALRELGEQHRLGPATKYGIYLKRVPEYESAVLTDWSPIYLQGRELRLSGMLDEEIKVTFSWHPGQKALLIPSSMAEIAGIKVPDDATEVIVRQGDRSVRVRQFALPYLQFGSCLLRDVRAGLLPPEAEDLGASLGEAAFEGYVVTVQRERLRIVFRPTN
jgi:hypothetical protein